MRGSTTSSPSGIPKTKPQPMQPYRFAYTLYWTRETDLKGLSPNKVVATRVGADPREPAAPAIRH